MHACRSTLEDPTHEAYGRRGAIAPHIKPIASGLRLCAPAMTARTAPGNNLAVHQALYRSPAGWALAVATEGDRMFGYWGDLLTAAAQAHGLAGLVLEGSIRDVAEMRESGFAAFAGGISMRGTTKLPEGDVGGTIALGGVAIAAGDILVGDDDGLVAVALADAERVAAASAERVASEAANIEQLRAGARTLDLYGWPE